MGTDIHLYVEAMRWDYDPVTEDEVERWCFMMDESTTWGDRNYNVFAVLADVRNGRGFAGVKTGEGFNVIAQPRGFPEGMSAEMKRHAARADHTPSWLTLKEIYEFDWNQTTQRQGVVDAIGFQQWKLNGKPESWSGGVSGPDVRHISNEQMAHRIAYQIRPIPENLNAYRFSTTKIKGWEDLENLFTTVTWTETYAESCKGFLDWIYTMFGHPGEKYRGGLCSLARWSPENIRFIFWFDS